MSEKVSTIDVRQRIGDMLNRVALRRDEFVIERKGKALAVMMPVEKAESIRRAARLRLSEWLARPDAVKTDAEAMTLANEARRAARRIRK